jgi:hypothetical protein
MPTSFLDKVAVSIKFPAMNKLAARQQIEYIRMLDSVSRASQLLGSANIEHAMFKTIRPYKSTTVDIDTVIFGLENDYRTALKTMKESGYRLLAEGPMSATFWDQNAEIGIDIYNEIAVSALCYLDKDKLARFSTSVRLPNNEEACLLAPEADLLAIVAHSIIKEQMFTLSEYYSFINYLGKIEIRTFVDLLRETNLTNAAKTHASITAFLSKVADGEIPKKLQEILEAIGQDNFETSRILTCDLQTPHKYHPITVAKSLLEIAKGKKSRRSIATQIYRMKSPTFTGKFLNALIQHIARETY